MRYRTIVADPPWHYPFGHPAREHKKHPYPTMTIGDLCELPVSDWADQSAHLYLWTTNEHLRYAFQVLGAWGFTFKNVLVWCKPGLGMGGTFRNAHELILLGERGKCELKRRDQGTWFVLPNPRENSAKPEGFLDLVESVVAGAVPRDVRQTPATRLGYVGGRGFVPRRVGVGVSLRCWLLGHRWRLADTFPYSRVRACGRCGRRERLPARPRG
jgi:N6-adenosine-specific RNA methylase IME4